MSKASQISFLGEDVKVEPKAKKFDFLLQQLQSIISEKDKTIEELENGEIQEAK